MFRRLTEEEVRSTAWANGTEDWYSEVRAALAKAEEGAYELETPPHLAWWVAKASTTRAAKATGWRIRYAHRQPVTSLIFKLERNGTA